MELELISFNYRSSLLYEALRIYCTVWGRDKEESLSFFRKYARMPDFLGYVASVDNSIVGMGFGTASQTGQWWHDKVAEKIGKSHPALQDAWVLTELAVLRDYRQKNIGSLIHERLVKEIRYPNMLLSTQADNFGAKRFYEHRGWTYLHKGFAFQEGRPLYCIMHKDTKHGY
jgi:ribosomal protein S18 acetylase RimI-like enzyme